MDWALVSEPGFLNFQTFYYRYLVSQFVFGKSGGEISRRNNKGVLDRPWTKWRVFRAISGTLKFQLTVNPDS